MPSAVPAAAAPPPAAAAQSTSLGDNKGIKFQISTGGRKWHCTLQDRSHYERTKATRSDSSDSASSSNSSTA